MKNSETAEIHHPSPRSSPRPLLVTSLCLLLRFPVSISSFYPMYSSFYSSFASVSSYNQGFLQFFFPLYSKKISLPHNRFFPHPTVFLLHLASFSSIRCLPPASGFILIITFPTSRNLPTEPLSLPTSLPPTSSSLPRTLVFVGDLPPPGFLSTLD